jgi:hypothetical protein
MQPCYYDHCTGKSLNPAVADGQAALVEQWQGGPAAAVKVFYLRRTPSYHIVKICRSLYAK